MRPHRTLGNTEEGLGVRSPECCCPHKEAPSATGLAMAPGLSAPSTTQALRVPSSLWTRVHSRELSWDREWLHLTLIKDLENEKLSVIEDKNKNKKTLGGNINTIWGQYLLIKTMSYSYKDAN